MFCRNCGQKIDGFSQVCPHCGAQQTFNNSQCPNCGNTVILGSTTCTQCGANLAANQPKSRLVAGLLGIFLGAWGIHRFYLGYTNMGIIQIVVTICTCGIGGLWGFIEGILILTGSYITTDAQGRPLRD